MGPAFRLPFEALSAIEAQFGRARMLEHAIQAKDEATGLVALMMASDWERTINLITDLVRAQEGGKRCRIKRASRRVTEALADLSKA